MSAKTGVAWVSVEVVLATRMFAATACRGIGIETGCASTAIAPVRTVVMMLYVPQRAFNYSLPLISSSSSLACPVILGCRYSLFLYSCCPVCCVVLFHPRLCHVSYFYLLNGSFHLRFGRPLLLFPRWYVHI